MVRGMQSGQIQLVRHCESHTQCSSRSCSMPVRLSRTCDSSCDILLIRTRSPPLLTGFWWGDMSTAVVTAYLTCPHMWHGPSTHTCHTEPSAEEEHTVRRRVRSRRCSHVYMCMMSSIHCHCPPYHSSHIPHHLSLLLAFLIPPSPPSPSTPSLSPSPLPPPPLPLPLPLSLPLPLVSSPWC